MDEAVLKDTKKHVMVFAPAGSGKTQALAERYVALLREGVPSQRILALTFTEEAASEMKERVMKIIREEAPLLYERMRPESVRMRISTFHSFLKAFLFRFSSEAGVELGLRVLNPAEGRALFEEAKLSLIRSISPGNPLREALLDILGKRATESQLARLIEILYQKRPRVELLVDQEQMEGLIEDDLEKVKRAREVIQRILGDRRADLPPVFREGGEQDLLNLTPGLLLYWRDRLNSMKILKKPFGVFRSFGEKLSREEEDALQKALRDFFVHGMGVVGNRLLKDSVLPIYLEISKEFSRLKSNEGGLDFADMEEKAIRLLRGHPEISLALYAFDESTDHILVDEFQDTNFLQWEVVTHLTEEWRAGLGAKSEVGIQPTLFLVGDDKQSIYAFRGANVAVFEKAGRDLESWFGENFVLFQKEDNYRSLPAIVDFVNRVFSKVMVGGKEPWMTRYRPFKSRREKEGRGRVELISFSGSDQGRKLERVEARLKEARIVAHRIHQLLSLGYPIHQEGTKRPLEPRDIGILVKTRRYIWALEQGLKEAGIPCFVAKGIGFFAEPEIQVLLSLLYFLEDPTDDLALFRFLYGPWAKDLLRSPWSRAFIKGRKPLIQRLEAEGEHTLLRLLDSSVGLRDQDPLHRVLRRILREIQFYRYFPDLQSQANIEKFFDLLLEMESRNSSWSSTAQAFRDREGMREEGKALLDEGGVNAVSIMTIHGSKGLQFPVVIFAYLDERLTSSREDPLVILEREGTPRVLFRPHGQNFPAFSKYHPLREESKERDMEESKRLFYVAATRAQDLLILVANEDAPEKTFWGLLKEGLGLNKKEDSWVPEEPLQGFVHKRGEELLKEGIKKRGEERLKRPPSIYLKDPLEAPEPLWVDVTERMREQDGHFLLRWNPLGRVFGRTFHQFLRYLFREGVLLNPEQVFSWFEREFSREVVDTQKIRELIEEAQRHWGTLLRSGLAERVVLGRDSEGSFAELPFYFKDEGGILWKGRVDRVLLRENRVEIYDYKTFPVIEGRGDEIRSFYKPQLEIYEKAMFLFFKKEREVKSFLLFTSKGSLLSIS